MNAREPGWLTVYRCSQNDRHLLYLEAALDGYPEESAGPGHVETLWCLWGDGGVLERTPGPFKVVEMTMDDVEGAAPTMPIRHGA